MKTEERDILMHALGMRKVGDPSFRNHFVTGPGTTDYPHCEALVAAGMMRRRAGHLLTGGDPLFIVTDAGRAAMKGTP